MRMRGAFPMAMLLAGLGGTARAADETCAASRMMFVLDKSSSMTRMLDDRMMWDIAADALGEVARTYEDRVALGLNVFPEAGECSPGSVVVPPGLGTAATISAALADPPPDAGNYTPMAQTLDAVRTDPALTGPDVAPHVVLITDGWQWCSPYDPDTRFAPVESVRRLTQAGITTFVVGFGDGVDAAALNQMAVAAGTDRPGCDPAGEAPDAANPCYYQADSPSELLAALMDVADQVTSEEQCNGLDDDCDGQIDEDLTQACGGGCGMQVCEAGSWGACQSSSGAAETCNGIDDDCDGQIDEGCDAPADDPDDGYGVSGGGCSAGGHGFGGWLTIVVALAALRLGRRRRGALLAVPIVLATLGSASAQTGFSVERFRPGTDRDAVLDVEWADVPRHLDYDLALWLAAADDPLIAYRDVDGGTERIGSLVSRRIGANLVGSVALWNRLQLAADLPLIVAQDQNPDLGMTPTETRYTLGDLRFAPKLRVWGDRESAIAVIASFSLPTAGKGDYTGDPGLSFAPELAVSTRSGRFRFSGNAGYRVRERAEVVNLIVDDEIFGRLGAAYRLGDPDSGPELATSLGLATSASDPGSAANSNYVELLAGVTFAINDSLSAFAGGGVGLEQGFGSPDWRLIGGLRYYHRTHEPKPRPIAKRPPPAPAEEEPEEEEPEEELAVLKEDRIEILERIHFEFDKAVILEESYPILDAVARIIRRHPELAIIRVEGHTDAKASHTYNDSLSQRRAEAVREYLSNRGVDDVRLEAVGYGETRPIATNATDEGRAANRRVQFMILERGGGAPADEQAKVTTRQQVEGEEQAGAAAPAEDPEAGAEAEAGDDGDDGEKAEKPDEDAESDEAEAEEEPDERPAKKKKKRRASSW
jgi:uncharacterized protein (TIGR03382 family)